MKLPTLSRNSIYNLVLAAGMLLTGCLNTLSKKAQNNTEAAGYDGDVHSFTHPWFQTLIMFMGEFMCMFGLLVQRYHERRTWQAESAPINADAKSISDMQKPPQAAHTQTPIFQKIILLPTLLDLMGTTFGGIGLVYCSASIWQMLRGSIIIFTGIMSKLFLKRVMLPYRWVAIAITATGVVLVGVSELLADSLIKESTSTSSSSGSSGFDYMVLFGMFIILLGQFVGAIQMVVEEKFIKQRNFVPMHVVGMEGLFGALIMAFIVLPALFVIPGKQDCPLPYNDWEDSWDAILMIIHSWQLGVYVFVYFCSIAFYNFFGLSVTQSLTCVHRTLIDACRTIIVWLVELMIHAIDSSRGEAWTVYSWVQGFSIGTITYNGIVKIPFMNYTMPETSALDKEKQPLLAPAPAEPTSGICPAPSEGTAQ